MVFITFTTDTTEVLLGLKNGSCHYLGGQS